MLHCFFRNTLFFGLVVLGVFGSPRTARSQSNEFRALWVDAWGDDVSTQSRCQSLINNTRDGNLNALVVQVRRRGDSFYNSDYEPKCSDVSPQSFDPLAFLLSQAHDTSGGKQKVEIHAWIVTYHIWKGTSPPPQPDHPLNLHPDWLLRDVNNNTYIDGHYTFDPGHPAVQQHTFDVCMNLVTNYNVDGLNFDYIRYSSINEGYNPVSVARFNRRYGRSGQPAPADELWKQFRRDQVTQLLRKVYLSAIAVRPEITISADTITWAPGPTSDETWYSLSAAWNSVLQDWRGWMEEGILDLNIPMNYFRQWTHPTDYVNWSTFAKDRRFNRHVAIGPGIYLNSVADGIAQMRQTREATALGNKADGVCGYVYKQTNKDGVATPTFLRALVAPSAYDPITPPMFQQKVPVPVMPWKTAPTRGHLKGMLYGASPTNGLDGGSITITGPVNRELLSDGTGFFGAVDLIPGNYTAMASFPGYNLQNTNFTITTGRVTTIDFLLHEALLRITQHPQNRTVNAGQNATFNVAASGVPPLNYQWRFAFTNIPSATSASYTRTNVQGNNGGNYSVIVTDATGSVLSSNAFLTVNLPPSIISQPQSVLAAQGSNVTFRVAASGTSPLYYQWRLNGTNILGATASAYTRPNVQPADEGHYSVMVSNSIGSVISDDAVLTVEEEITPPQIVVQPQNQSVTEGQSLTLAVSANGSLPLNYQWLYNAAEIPDANNSNYTIGAVSPAHAGNYAVRISNNGGSVLSQNAALNVLPPFRAAGVEWLWQLAPGSRTNVTTGGTERGLAYNPVSGNVLLVSRASGNRIYALDGDTGDQLRTMNTDPAVITGGTYALNMIGVADDGVVYAGNLVLTPPGFKIYRWPNDTASAAPRPVFNGNPGFDNTNRWGDTMDVRGAGLATQILLGSRNSPFASILTTADGTNFTATAIHVPQVPNGGFGLGIAFGRGNTFWGKTSGGLLRHIAFDLNNGAGTVLATYPSFDVPSTIGPIGINVALDILGGVAFETPDALRIYQLSPSAPPRFVAAEPFATDNANAFGTGSVDFGDDRVYTLDTNNGLLAFRILPVIVPVIHGMELLAGNRIRLRVSDAEIVLEASSDLIGWDAIPFERIDEDVIEFNDTSPARFYRLTIP